MLRNHANRWITEAFAYETIGSGYPYDLDWEYGSSTTSLLINPDEDKITTHPKFLGNLECDFVDVSSNGNIVELPVKNSGVIIKLEVTSNGVEYVY